MNQRTARAITRLYPREWRVRYGEEFCVMLELCPGDARTAINAIGAAVREHLFPTRGATMHERISFRAMMQQPSACAPIAMSLVALAMLLVSIVVGLHHGGGSQTYAPGTTRPDEGSVAHLWQLLMTIQLPIVLWFVVKWVRRAPTETLGMVALQAVAWLASCAPVFLLHL